MIRLILLLVFLIIFFIISLPCYGVLYILRRFAPVKANEISLTIVRWALRICTVITGSSVTVEGRENIPTDKAVLYIGNHTSYFDIVTTYPVIPGRVGYLAKKEIGKVPLLGWWMPLLNGIMMDRKNPREGMRAILQAIDYVKEGVSIFIFPEGTRIKGGEVGEFKGGSFKVATRTNCAIVPVAISGTADILENHMPFVKPSDVVIRFGNPIYPGELDPEDKKKIAPYVREKIIELLD